MSWAANSVGRFTPSQGCDGRRRGFDRGCAHRERREGAALPIYYTRFDVAFFRLPPTVQSRIEAKIDEMGLRLDSFLHHRLKATDRYYDCLTVVLLLGRRRPAWTGIRPASSNMRDRPPRLFST
jgi:hypothetical protein